MRAWHVHHLGFKTDLYGTSFEWREADQPERKGHTVWSTFPADTTNFVPGIKS